MNTLQFLKAVYGQDDILEQLGAYLAISPLPRDKKGAKPTWRFQRFGSAVTQALQSKQTHNIYFNIGLQKENLGPQVRGDWKNICAHPGFYLDIDIANGEAHKKPNIPKSKEEALAIFKEGSGGREPTLAVDSGYGLHLYMLAPSLILLETPEQKAAYQKALIRFHLHFANVMAKHNYTLDSTFDLPRILRLPGTLNWKIPDHPKECVVDAFTHEAVYQPEEWLEMCPEYPGGYKAVDNIISPEDGTPKTRVVQKKITLGARDSENKFVPDDSAPAIVVDRNAKVAPEMVTSLRANYPSFTRLWDRTDKEARIASKEDVSASSYEMGLVNVMVAAGLEDQEIANAMIQFRRKEYANENPNWFDKLKRHDYIPGTIKAARGISRKGKKKQDDTPPVEAKKPETPEELDNNLRAISEVMGIQVGAIIKYKGENNSAYVMETDKGTIKVPRTESLLNPSHFRTCVADATNVIMPIVKAAKWGGVAQMILNAAVEEDVQDSSPQEICANYIRQHIMRSNSLNDWKQAHLDSRPFLKKDRYYIFLAGIRHVMRSNGHNFEDRQIGLLLKALGCRAKRHNFDSLEGKRTSAWVYEVPNELINCEVHGLEEDSEERCPF